MYVLNLIDNSNWKFTRSGQKASLWNWYKWGAWNIQWGGVSVQPTTGWMSSITCARYTSHRPPAPNASTYDCVTSQPPWDFPCGLTEPHSSRPQCIYQKPHLCHRCQRRACNNLSLFLFARFILSQCDSPISHIGTAVNPGFGLRSNCWISYRADLLAHGDTAALCSAAGQERARWIIVRPEFNIGRWRGEHLYHISSILPAEIWQNIFFASFCKTCIC